MDIVTLKIELECEPDSLHSPVIREIFRNALEHIIALEGDKDRLVTELYRRTTERDKLKEQARHHNTICEGLENHAKRVDETADRLTDQITKWHHWAETNGVFIPDYLKTDELKAALAVNKEE